MPKYSRGDYVAWIPTRKECEQIQESRLYANADGPNVSERVHASYDIHLTIMKVQHVDVERRQYIMAYTENDGFSVIPFRTAELHTLYIPKRVGEAFDELFRPLDADLLEEAHNQYLHRERFEREEKK